tara:strand:+ start:2127 stop:2993 length:867 start_codon:yes stop_codon:yes gene_type:complete
MARQPSAVYAYSGQVVPATVDANAAILPLATGTVDGAGENYEFTGGIPLAGAEYVTIFTKSSSGGTDYYGAAQEIPTYDVNTKKGNPIFCLHKVNLNEANQSIENFIAAGNKITERALEVRTAIPLGWHSQSLLNTGITTGALTRFRVKMTSAAGTSTETMNAYIINGEEALSNGGANTDWAYVLQQYYDADATTTANFLVNEQHLMWTSSSNTHDFDIPAAVVAGGTQQDVTLTLDLVDANGGISDSIPLGIVNVDLGAPGACTFTGQNTNHIYASSSMSLSGTITL